MIVIQFLRWIRGYVIFTATGLFPERFINLALRENITLIDPVGEKGKLTAQVSIGEYKELRHIRKNAGVKLRITQKKGFPFLLYKNKRRSGILVGAVLFLLIINVLSMFIWSVEITGANAMSQSKIRESLKKHGIAQGVYKGNIDVAALERQVSLDLGQVAWISVNIMGSNAHVELSESVKMPDIIPSNEPCNLKASEAGQIVRMEVRKGSSAVKIGDGVAKGQLLVSGVVENAENKVLSLQHSEGRIFAARQSETKVVVPVKRQVSLPTGQEICRKQVTLWGLTVPLTFTAVPNEQYIAQMVNQSVVVNDNVLPISLTTQYNYEYQTVTKTYTQQQAKKIGEAQLVLHEIFAMWDVEIVKQTVKETKEKGNFIYDAVYDCIEDIAVSSPIGIAD